LTLQTDPNFCQQNNLRACSPKPHVLLPRTRLWATIILDEERWPTSSDLASGLDISEGKQMTQAAARVFTFEEFLTHDDGTDTRYELRRGVLVPMNPPRGKHIDIAEFIYESLKQHIRQQKLPLVPKLGSVYVQVLQEEGKDSARIPDVCVLSAEQWEQMQERPAAIALKEPPPALVVEVVSTNWQDDYLHKLAEYEQRGIQEYWIVDYLALGAVRYIGSPKLPTLSIYQLGDGEYQEMQQYRGSACVVSKVFPELSLTANEIFRGGRPD